MAFYSTRQKATSTHCDFPMILETKHRTIWKGNLWSDIDFAAKTVSKILSPIVGFRVFLDMEKADGNERVLVPCSSMVFDGSSPSFHFDSKNPSSFVGQCFTQDLAAVCDLLFDHECLIRARVHHDVLIGDFVSLRLIVLVATNSFSRSVMGCDHLQCIEECFLHQTCEDANLSILNVDLLTIRSDDVK